MRLAVATIMIAVSGAAWGQSSDAPPYNPAVAAKAHSDIVAFAARHGMSEEEFARSVGSSVDGVEGFVYASDMLGSNSEAALNSLVKFSQRLQE